MSRIKTVFYSIFLVLFVFLGFLLVIPDVIPSFEIIQQIIILILYLANIVFVYVIAIRFRTYIRKKRDRVVATTLTTVLVIFMIGGLLFSFIITTLGIGQGFMGGTLEKEFNFPKHHVTIYLYDDSFLDPLTTIKIKDKTFPVMHHLASIETCEPSELTIWRHDDIVEFSCNNIVVRINLVTLGVKKTINNPENQE